MDMEAKNSDENKENTGAIEIARCKTATDPAVRMFIGTLMLLGFAVYCFVDAVPPPDSWSMDQINPATEYVLHIAGPWTFGIPGLILAAWAVLFMKKVLVADSEGIGYQGKQRIAWSAVTRLDAKDLQSKGILVLHFKSDDEAGGKLVLDSWKLRNFRDLVAVVEKNVPKNIRDIR